MTLSPALSLYLAASRMAAPLARLLLARRAARGKEDAARLGERMGRASAERPEGPLVWVHGASVGEGLAALTLIEAMAARRPDLAFLLTTGTRASAQALGPRLPKSVVHQFAPVDVWPFLQRFLAHWRPCLAVRIDSELWPATLVAAERAGAKVALANARLSERSAARWGRAPGLARAMMARVSLALAQDAPSAERLTRLGARLDRVVVAGPLKSSASPPEADDEALRALRDALAGRPVWAAVSTHPGEEAAAIAAHLAACGRLPGLLTLVAPRHAERGGAIAAEAAAAMLAVARRSIGETPAPDTALYVADTFGEMGLWLRLAPFVFVGGSLTPVGGHNPYEPASLGALVAHGPHVANFADAYAALGACARAVDGAATIAAALTQAVQPGGGLAPAAAADAAAGRLALAPDPGVAARMAEALAALAPPPPPAGAAT
ncbi:3-deoxy-D-manno-octulosonic acid transferase [Rubrimonas cliftonensis]|uniref:3-deoxy-D-manno-octulosonic acid transferase n=1 Tax=Rubrimonas cliftonensis TaxID=89524 RepID=A0A1H3YBE8_9RHOB|nr:glycosyltransferase N-terminal domain-containing protein [Rubrimonas cliftonensis]SEA08987.1 3-deoxy-D-manno-octulosonic-acid transferase [Rubrimonas cliftonensis]